MSPTVTAARAAARETARPAAQEAARPVARAVADASDAPTAKEMLVHEMLARIADKWTLVAIDALEEGGTLRFGELRERMGPVSQKMLTKALRQLERDGLVTRVVYPQVPPRVEYRLTPLGRGLGESVCGIWSWAARHLTAVERARQAYDARKR